ncbi:MAG: HNH endonuclease [Hyphomicrobiales bacterium]|nr:HNH endonuclease [Hyphomicrobiales bacterium]
MRTILAAAALALAATGALARDLPDPALTPGAVTDLSVEEVCARKWGRDVRHVTAAMKREVFRRYGMSGNNDRRCKPDTNGRRCEIDHMVPRSLAGADAIENLWSQPFGTSPWNAAKKDRLEVLAHKKVCRGEMTLHEGQQLFLSGKWTDAYIRFFGRPNRSGRR